MSKIKKEDIFDADYIEFIEKQHIVVTGLKDKVSEIFWRGVMLGMGIMGIACLLIVYLSK